MYTQIPETKFQHFLNSQNITYSIKSESINRLNLEIQLDRKEIFHENLLDKFEKSKKLRNNLTHRQRELAKKYVSDFKIHLEKSRFFLKYVYDELKANNLPLELAVIPMIESNFNPYQISHANAHGFWQFRKITGKEYNLNHNANYNDYRDIQKSTKAAIKLFKHLYSEFKNWDKVVIAYNAGELRLKKNPNLKSNYLNKFKIFSELLMNHTKYNIDLKIYNRKVFRHIDYIVLINNNLYSFDDVSELLNLDVNKLKRLNSGYNSNYFCENGIIIPTKEYEYLFKK